MLKWIDLPLKTLENFLWLHILLLSMQQFLHGTSTSREITLLILLRNTSHKHFSRPFEEDMDVRGGIVTITHYLSKLVILVLVSCYVPYLFSISMQWFYHFSKISYYFLYFYGMMGRVCYLLAYIYDYLSKWNRYIKFITNISIFKTWILLDSSIESIVLCLICEATIIYGEHVPLLI